MKKVLFYLLLLATSICHAQNYNCLQFGPKNYFTNGNGYLRGIRIDSVTVIGTDTIYHAFHTPRAMGYATGCNIPAFVDSDGGSWLGKNVIQQMDGTFLFDNFWHDTVIIKSRAAVGDSWMFFNDATNIHYTALVTALDTMTVLGVLDSIKTITISADTAGVPRTTDPVNNFQLKLSKDHGFVQVFDLYTFPYHMPDSLSDISCTEYYLDLVLGRLFNPGYDIIPGPWHWSNPDTVNSIFHLVALHNATTMEIYDFAVGDVYKHSWAESHMLGGGYDFVSIDYEDTVTTRFHTSTSNASDISERRYQMMMPSGSTSFSASMTSVGGNLTPIIDTTKMPEESGSTYYYNYLPDDGPDTALCSIKGKYIVNVDHIAISGEVHYESNSDVGLAIPTQSWTYYVGYGQWEHHCNNVMYEIQTDEYTSYFYKNGTVCYGAYRWLAGINDVNAQVQLQLLPNPANNLLTIKTNITGVYTITLTNMLGQPITELRATTTEEKINLTHIANGLYTVALLDQNGNRITRKLVVAH